MNQTESIQNRTAEEKEAIHEEWKVSGLSKKEFCKRKNINYQTFIWWLSSGKRRKNGQSTAKFIPVKLEGLQTGVSTEVHLSNSRKIIFYGGVSSEILKAVLQC